MLGALGMHGIACSAARPPGEDDLAVKPEPVTNTPSPTPASAAVDSGAAAPLPQEDIANFQNVDAGTFLCNPYATWAEGAAVPGLSTTHAIHFSITPDELSAAWVEDVGGSYAYFTAERASAADAFEAKPLDVGDVAPLGLSLSPDGLRLALVNSNKRGFLTATRASRTSSFDAPSDTELKTINQWSASLGKNVGDPVYGGDGSTFFYSMFAQLSTISESRSSAPSASAPVWPAGAPRGEPSLGAVDVPLESDGGMTGGTERFYRRPVSLSTDGLTLFITDEYPSRSPTARAVFRTSKTEPFTMSASLGAWSAVHANQSCNALYYVEDGNIRLTRKK